MEHVQPDVMPDELWTAIRAMGDAMGDIGALSGQSPQREVIPNLVEAIYRWSCLVTALEAWTGVTDLALQSGETLIVNDSWVASAALDVEVLTARIACDTARRGRLQALLAWHESHLDDDESFAMTPTFTAMWSRPCRCGRSCVPG